jgi:hypothetical protein
MAQLFKHEERCHRYSFLGAKKMRMMEPLKFFEGTGNKNNVTVTIFYLIGNGCYFLSLNDAALV